MAKDYADHPAAAHLPDRSLIQAIGATHDLGHPPFGHGGEVALNYCMRDHGGFEGNGQTLRILSRLETFSASAGANLTRRTLLGVLKYPVAYSAARNPAVVPALCDGPTSIKLIDRKSSKPPKCYFDSETEITDWIFERLSAGDRERFIAVDRQDKKHHKPRYKSFDCSIMDVADDIAYGVHDLEDAIALGLVTRARFQEGVTPAACAPFLDMLVAKYKDQVGNNPYGYLVDQLFGDAGRRKHNINRLVGHFITNITIVEDEGFIEPLLKYRAQLPAPQQAFLTALKDLVCDEVILNPSVQHLEFKGQTMVVAVFEALQSDPKRLLPRNVHTAFADAGGDVRIICDFVAAMTDTHLLKTYERLFSPRMGSVFDQI